MQTGRDKVKDEKKFNLFALRTVEHKSGTWNQPGIQPMTLRRPAFAGFTKDSQSTRTSSPRATTATLSRELLQTN